MRNYLRRLLVTLFIVNINIANATVVEFRTVMGNIQVNLFDDTTPITVENFLDYVNSGAYANSIIHRSVEDFVVQGGGYVYSDALPLDAIPVGLAIQNEPELSNVAGTIAMAKVANNPNSATSQFYFNLADNSQNLDVQNGGFTVFGQVLGNGMEILQEIQNLPVFNMGGVASSIPLRNYSAADADNGVEPNAEHLVIIEDIVVIDNTVTTHPELQPVENTLINSNSGTPDVDDNNDSSRNSSGGSLAWFAIVLLTTLAYRRRRHNQF